MHTSWKIQFFFSLSLSLTLSHTHTRTLSLSLPLSLSPLACWFHKDFLYAIKMLLQHSVEWHSSNATKEKDKIHLRFNRLKIFKEKMTIM